MAWVTKTWEMEQGKDALLPLRFWQDSAKTQPWPFIGWDVNATVSDTRGRNIWPVTIRATPESGLLDLIFPEDLVNALKASRAYRYDCGGWPPGSTAADDHFLAAGSVTVALRTSRRDP
jgi:hypothetical protein